jgi:serpin B
MKLSSIRTIAVSLSIALLLPPASCATTGSQPPVRGGADAGAYAAFGFDLYRAMLAETGGENVVISPASVGFALAMTMNGAEGPTRTAMAGVLHSAAGNNSADSILIAGTNEPIERVELSVANSLWARRGLDFKKDFLEKNKRYYGAEVRTIDFDDPGAAGRINEWVAAKTKDRIKGIVDTIDPGSILFLVNAVYFKGSWTREFDPKLTKEEIFYLPGGGTANPPMMRQSGEYLYLRGNGFQALSLPYGDGRTSMYVFLPDDRAGLDAFNDSLTAESWETWMSGFTSRRGRIALPRFTIEFKASLKRSLATLGMADAFDGNRANFRGMIAAGGANVYIHDVLHKTYIAVNEEGTEAAAATSVEIRVTSAVEPQTPFEMVCDHPFFIAIRDNETGLMLFMGSIVMPL